MLKLFVPIELARTMEKVRVKKEVVKEYFSYYIIRTSFSVRAVRISTNLKC